jgi:hypothetical protein
MVRKVNAVHLSSVRGGLGPGASNAVAGAPSAMKGISMSRKSGS